ncbi:hypothetical protein SLEP1_g25543 [Rubroshorea leprosula]|uniref:cyclin-dependent kinase n=1 Tax=Rubroshorea leprosula TaxID=152421 RepID=A0AAV5JQG0_9ROSI|nr:hypothetical protein SLEP1_g25543 [Rubroshorea leprosula]
MAAGKYGGYRDNESRDRESDVSRREFVNSKKHDRARNGSRDLELSRTKDVRDRMRIRQKDIKEREVINGGNPSSSRSDSGSSGGGNPGPREGDFSHRSVDREPGELSSESGSEDVVDSELQAKATVSVKETENGAWSPMERKRKFSPIVWDRDDKEVSNFTRSRKSTAVTTLPLQPPLPKAYRDSPNPIADGGVRLSPIGDSNSQKLLSLTKSEAPSVTAAESPVGFVPSPSADQQWGNDQEGEHQEDEDYVPTRNISSSRWASDDSSPGDEVEILDEEMPKRRKKMPASESLQDRTQNKSATPEVGVILREGSKALGGRSSSVEEQDAHSRSGSREDYPGNDLGKEDYMEIDNEYGSVSQSDTDTDTVTGTEDESDSQGTLEPAPPQRSINMLQGCRSVDEFERLNKIDEGTYGVVYRARDKKSGEIVALKKVKMEKEREGFPLTSLREINILLSFHHQSIVDVKEVVVGSSLDSIFMVMEYMEHDLKGLMESMKQPFSQSEVKCLMLQLLEGVKYLHDNWVLHRDLKTSNLLLNNRGELKICDFGLARQYGSPLKPYTHLVVTLWYRAPELLLGAKQYSTAIDMWSLGCIMAELLSKEPLFNGKTEFDQLDKIFRILGTPNETIWPGFSKLPGVKVNFVKHQYNLLRKKFPATSFTGSPVLSDAGFDLLNKLLTYDPEKRITVEAALNHEWFREVPLPKSKDFMPTFPAQHAQDRRLRRILKSPDPLEEQRRKELQQAEIGTGGLFG